MSPHGEDEPQVSDGPHGERQLDPEDETDGGRDEAGGGTMSRVSVTVDENHLASLPQVVEALRSRGMQVDAVLEGLGMVTGSAPDADSLRQVEGVSRVDPQLEHQLPPPEDDIQ